MGLRIATWNFTRYADGDVSVAEDESGVTVRLTQDQAAELDNYLLATASALQPARDEIGRAAIEEDQQRLIDEALRTTEVEP